MLGAVKIFLLPLFRTLDYIYLFFDYLVFDMCDQIGLIYFSYLLQGSYFVIWHFPNFHIWRVYIGYASEITKS